MTRNWLGVASADHVRLGRAGGFMQLGHGKRAPLRRVQPGDRIVYYSPTTVYGEKDRLQSFTAIGVVKEGEPYEGAMGSGFRAFRRDVNWSKAAETPIAGLLDRLDLTKGKPNWGYQLRFGLIEISARDMGVIARAMGAKVEHLS
ncbi:MAG TPA: EVE domain-containing protein [Pseudolabrys sp.]|nr:EVE domain-containing protein [Pseudolabrys sp.]